MFGNEELKKPECPSAIGNIRSSPRSRPELEDGTVEVWQGSWDSREYRRSIWLNWTSPDPTHTHTHPIMHKTCDLWLFYCLLGVVRCRCSLKNVRDHKRLTGLPCFLVSCSGQSLFQVILILIEHLLEQCVLLHNSLHYLGA